MFMLIQFSMDIIVNLKVEVDSGRVPSSYHHEVVHFSVSELGSHFDNMGKVLDKKKDDLRYTVLHFECRLPTNFTDSPGGGIAIM